MIEQIRELTEQGFSQREICERLNLSRGTVYRRQKELGICLPRYGPRAPELSERQAAQVLTLLRTGAGTKRIADQLGLRCHAVRSVSEKHGFRHTRGPGQRHRLSPTLQAKILREIREHRNCGLDLAEKFGVSYKLVLRLAHKELACLRFCAGAAQPPLSSNFPQRQHHSNV